MSAGTTDARSQFGSLNVPRTSIPTKSVPMPVKTPTVGVLKSVRRFAAHSQSLSWAWPLNMSGTRDQNPPAAQRQGVLDCVFIRAFDESIRLNFDEPICVGGYLFKQAASEKFKCQWHSTVSYGERRFTVFHTFDFCGSNDTSRACSRKTARPSWMPRSPPSRTTPMRVSERISTRPSSRGPCLRSGR
jgi:hypothetical protein